MNFFEELLDQDQQEEKEEVSHYTPGITTGIVKENWDQKFPGMVKVELMLGETGQKVTDWIRVAVPYAGNGIGEYFLPEVDTEVVVAFNMGDVNCPIVLGCLWNNKDVLPTQTALEGNTIKRIKTKGGHEIIFDDKKEEESIEIHTPGKLKVSLADKEKKIEITDSSGENKIIIDGESGAITVKGKNKITFNVGGDDMLILDGTAKSAELKATNIKMTADAAMDLAGQQSIKMKAAMVEMNAQGSLKAESSGIVTVKGSLVKIN